MASPPPYRPRKDRPVWEDEHGSRPWDERDARHRPKHYWTSEAMVLEKVGEFILSEVGPGRPASQDRYQAWAALADDRPSTTVLDGYGGLKALVKKVGRAGVLEKAKREAERQTNPTPEELEAREQEKLAAIVAKPQCQQILALVGERGEVGAREIEAAPQLGQRHCVELAPPPPQGGPHRLHDREPGREERPLPASRRDHARAAGSSRALPPGGAALAPERAGD